MMILASSPLDLIFQVKSELKYSEKSESVINNHHIKDHQYKGKPQLISISLCPPYQGPRSLLVSGSS